MANIQNFQAAIIQLTYNVLAGIVFIKTTLVFYVKLFA